MLFYDSVVGENLTKKVHLANLCSDYFILDS